MTNIWQKLHKPIFCLAPMFGATDSAFRQLVTEVGKPDLMFTEFVNVQAIFSPDETATQLLAYSSQEQPLIAQIWGLDPELFEAAADVIVRAGFSGIDLNFACPVRAVVKKGCGSAMIDNPELVGKIITSTIKGAAGRLPVSVKTRLGYKTLKTEEWLKFLLGFDLAAITVHGRIGSEMSLKPVHWDELVKVVDLRNRLKSKTLIIINGDLFTREEALAKIKLTGADGAMIGRGVFHDPYIFNPKETIKTKTKEEKLALLKRHLDIYEQTWGDSKAYYPLKRFFKIYVNGFRGALALRIKLMATDSIAQARDIIG